MTSDLACCVRGSHLLSAMYSARVVDWQASGGHLSRRVGKVILAEQPYAHALHADEMSARCDVTLREGNLQRCSGCKHVW